MTIAAEISVAFLALWGVASVGAFLLLWLTAGRKRS
jgi:hypothetical protein